MQYLALCKSFHKKKSKIMIADSISTNMYEKDNNDKKIEELKG